MQPASSTERTECPWRKLWRKFLFSLPPRRRPAAKSLKPLMAEVFGGSWRKCGSRGVKSLKSLAEVLGGSGGGLPYTTYKARRPAGRPPVSFVVVGRAIERGRPTHKRQGLFARPHGPFLGWVLR
jgi:hypothetical protein